jgi:hypothetical protein
MLSVIETGLPYWEDYRKLLGRLPAAPFPGADTLSRLLPANLRSLGGSPIRFVPASAIPGVQYEQHIHATGEVSTRAENWHDLFNALAWCRWPKIKRALNALHIRHALEGHSGTRGRPRDALTLFDESGAMVVSSDRDKLDLLAMREWDELFQADASPWHDGLRIFLIGHSLLEKFLRPYKSITAHALLVHVGEDKASRARWSLLTALDELLAGRLLDEQLFLAPAGLSPLPLMGIPGWWAGQAQNAGFYADSTVFRPAPENFLPPPVFTV